MENKSNAKASFEEFAKNKLQNHLEELSVRYQNEKIDNETKQKAYQAHQKIYTDELNEKINAILADNENEDIESELQNLKTEYISKLNGN